MNGPPKVPLAWGVTAAEIDDVYPCTALVPAGYAMWRGVDVAAPAAVAFAWVEQLRIAPYSYDLIDNLGRRSPHTLSPAWGPARPGQPFIKVFTIVDVVPGREITARATERTRRTMGDTAVTYRVTSVHDHASRIVVRMDVETDATGGTVGAVVRRVLPWGDLVMMRRQLRNLAARAEAQIRATPGSP